MKFCIVFEVARPCRWFKYEHPGRLRRVMFLWFSVCVFPYSWTEFLKRYRLAVEKTKDKQKSTESERERSEAEPQKQPVADQRPPEKRDDVIWVEISCLDIPHWALRDDLASACYICGRLQEAGVPIVPTVGGPLVPSVDFTKGSLKSWDDVERKTKTYVWIAN